LNPTIEPTPNPTIEPTPNPTSSEPTFVQNTTKNSIKLFDKNKKTNMLSLSNFRQISTILVLIFILLFIISLTLFCCYKPILPIAMSKKKKDDEMETPYINATFKEI
jgi:hypothetical protein